MKKRVDRRVKRTRDMLRKGLAHLLEEKSIKEITVSELVDYVDINRSTFYLHYKDIFDLLDHIEKEIIEEITIAMEEEVFDPNKGKQNYPLVERIFRILYENKEICKALLGPNGDYSFVIEIEKIVENATIESFYEKFPENIGDVNFIYSFCITGCAGLIKTWLAGGAEDTPEHMAYLTFKMIEGTKKTFIG
ncbi:MAG: TetR/AcrR family transcriptional regulator [Lachnospiraceae bacterium]|nr:TetR/AcrR family transcriptional regulator [Lachnospiraceae bacterium]